MNNNKIINWLNLVENIVDFDFWDGLCLHELTACIDKKKSNENQWGWERIIQRKEIQSKIVFLLL